MRTLALFLVAAALVAAVAIPAWAQASFPLEYRMVKEFSHQDQAVYMAARFFGGSRGRNADIKGTPPAAKGELACFTCQSGAHTVIVAVDSADPPNLFVGKDCGNDFSEAKSVRRTKLANSNMGMEYQYGPVVLKSPGAEGEGGRVLFATRNGSQMLAIFPAGYVTGQMKVGAKTFKVAAIDGNFDGQYESRSVNDLIANGRYRSDGDLLAVDMTGDGQFSYMSNGQMEIRPLTKMLCLSEKYYDVKVAKDGSSIALSLVEPKMGTLAIENAKADLLVMGDCGPVNLNGPKTQWQLPEGRYTCQEVKLRTTDKNGQKWVLETSGKTGKLSDFRIEAEQTQALELGLPLAIKVDIQRQGSGGVFAGKTMGIGFEMVGVAGEEYSPAAEKNGSRVPAPKITIYNEKDEILASGDFEYG